DHQKFQSKSESLPARFKRAAPDKSPVTEVISRHLAIGRVLNAIYLQMQLDNGTITQKDILAGIWNLKNSSVIDKLVGLTDDGIKSNIIDLEKSIDAVSGGIGAINGVERLLDEDGIWMEVTKSLRQKLKDGLDKIKVLQSLVDETNSKTLQYFVEDFEVTILEKLVSFETVTFNQMSIRDLVYSIENFMFLSTTISPVLKTISQSTHFKMNALLEGINATAEIYENASEIGMLNPMFQNIKIQAQKFQSLLASPETIEKLLSRLKDLKDSWVRTVLNKGMDLDDLKAYLVDFLTSANSLEKVNKDSVPMFNSSVIESLDYTLALINSLRVIKKVPKDMFLTDFNSCFKVLSSTSIVDYNETELFETSVVELFKTPPKVMADLETLSQDEDFSKSIYKFKDDLNNMRTEAEFATWKSRGSLKAMKEYFEGHRKLFKSLKQETSFIESVNVLLRSKQKITEISSWMANAKLGTPACDFLFELDASMIQEVNRMSSRISRIRTKNDFENVKSLVNAVLDSTKSLKTIPNLNGNSSNSTRRRRSPTKKFNGDPKKLLNFAFAAHSFYQIGQIKKYSADLDLLIKKIPSVPDEIKKIKNPKVKTDLEMIWKNSASFVKFLINLKASNKRILNLVKSKPEKTLEEVGLQYKLFSSAALTGKFELRKLRESMKLLDTPMDDVEDALKTLEDSASMDWNLVFSNFKTIPTDLEDIQKQLLDFFEGEHLDDEVEGWKLAVYIGAGVLALVLIGVGAAVFAYWWILIRDPDMRSMVPKEKIYTAPEEVDYSYMQLQDSRLESNSRFGEGYGTKIFDLCERKQWEKVEKMVKAGALLDVCNGLDGKTCLHVAIENLHKETIELMIQSGADKYAHDYYGNDAVDFVKILRKDSDLFDDVYRAVKDTPFNTRLIPPNSKRFWNVLVFDKNALTRRQKKKLPLRIKYCITWGYKENMDLNSFSHIVLPKKYVTNMNDQKNLLAMDNNDLMTFKLLACMASLVVPSWLTALIDPQFGENAMDTDYKWYTVHTCHNGNVHIDTVFHSKTNQHKMRPKLLEQCGFHILETELLKNREGWEEVIKLFGGSVVQDIEADDEKTPKPYWTLSSFYKKKKWEQRSCIILKHSDSKIEKKWQSMHAMYTLVDFSFLAECIVRHYILPIDNAVVPLDRIASDKEVVRKREKKKKEEEDRIARALKTEPTEEEPTDPEDLIVYDPRKQYKPMKGKKKVHPMKIKKKAPKKKKEGTLTETTKSSMMTDMQ
nr:protein F40E12.2 [imported] - Caenorhabditis elegans [Caenorhabditis elegans]